MSIAAEASRSRSVIRGIEVAANFATLVVAVLLSVVLVRNYLHPGSSAPPLPSRPVSTNPAGVATVATNLSKRLPGVNWKGNGRTLILALSTHCHFCTESAPFFRHVRESVGDNVKLIGVLPEPVAESESYLNQKGVHLDEVKQLQLDKLGVLGTPTMLLVNSSGIVMQTWVGKLEPDKQEEALKTILRSRLTRLGAGAAVPSGARS